MKWAREQAKLTHRTLAKKAGMSSGTISQIEHDLHPTTTDKIVRLAEVLGVTPCWLAFGDGPEPEGWGQRDGVGPSLSGYSKG